MPIADMSVKRDAFEGYVNGSVDEATLKRSTELSAPGTTEGHELFKPKRSPFGSGFSFGYRQNLGGPDGFILYQVSANYSASYFFGKNVWLTGSASQNLLNNYDKFKYDAPSNLPRVRTDVRKYTRTSDFTIPNLQLNLSRRLSRDVYAIAYAGYLSGCTPAPAAKCCIARWISLGRSAPTSTGSSSVTSTSALACATTRPPPVTRRSTMLSEISSGLLLR